jgi:hypothetical protein
MDAVVFARLRSRIPKCALFIVTSESSLNTALFQSSAYEQISGLDILGLLMTSVDSLDCCCFWLWDAQFFPMNGLRVVFESGALSPVRLFLSLLSAAAAGCA